MTSTTSDHMRIDARNLAFAQLVAQKLIADPGLLRIAKDNIARWQRIDDIASIAVSDWALILELPLPEIIKILIDGSQRSTRLRQSSPFGGTISQSERAQINQSVSPRNYYVSGADNT